MAGCPRMPSTPSVHITALQHAQGLSMSAGKCEYKAGEGLEHKSDK